MRFRSPLADLDPKTISDWARELPEGVTVLALAGPEIALWDPREVGLADEFAAEMVERSDLPVGWIQEEQGVWGLRPGLRLVPRRTRSKPWRWPRAPEASKAEALDLRVMRHLRDLDLAPATVSKRLARALSKARAERGNGSAVALEPRVQLDQVELPDSRGADSTARIRLRGWVAAYPPVRRLALRVGSRRYSISVDSERADVAAALPWVADLRCGFRFEHSVSGFKAGRYDVKLERLDGRLLRAVGTFLVSAREETAQLVDRGHGLATSGLRAESATLDWLDGASRFRWEGLISGAARLHCVRLKVDGRTVLDADPSALVDATKRDGERRMRIDEALMLDAGSHEIRIELRRKQEVVESWTEVLDLAPPPKASPSLRCEELDRRVREGASYVWGDLRLAGRVEGVAGDAEVSLKLDGETVDQSTSGAGGSFELVARNPADAVSMARLTVRRGAEEEIQSPAFEVRFRSGGHPAGWPRWIEAITAALGPRAGAMTTMPPSELAARIAARDVSRAGELDAALRLLARNVERSRSASGSFLGEPMAPLERRLRVLFSSWEVPWSGHGGGVAMINLLRHLGTRHDITLLHPVYPGAQGLSEEVRPYVREILTVPRGWQTPSRPTIFGVPTHFLQTYSSGLLGALSAEAISGRYDLINLEGEGMALYADLPGLLPRVGSVYELQSFARAVDLEEQRVDSKDDLAARAANLIAELYFDVEVMARRFGHLVLLTAPEAEFLSPFLVEPDISLNPIAIDVEKLARGATRSSLVERPTFAYVGAFRHPPNRQAARVLIDEIVPLLRRRLPEAVVVLAGADLPADLVDAAQAEGVRYLGWVDDLPGLLGSVTAVLAPIRTGGGMRVKLLEAMACGAPVVTTPLGMSGIGACDGREYLRASSAEEFAAAAELLVNEPARARGLGVAAQALIAREHGIEVQGARRERIWARCLTRSAEDAERRD